MSNAIVPAARPETFEIQIQESNFAVQQSQRNSLTKFIKSQLKEDIDYGIIPGTKKKSLLKPGMQKILGIMGLYAHPIRNCVDLGGGHREEVVTVELRPYGKDLVVAVGMGSCSTLESKYRYRNDKRKCPKCGREGLIKSSRYNNWWCPKDDGCNASFKENDPAVMDQVVGKVENPDIADQYNTVLKMAVKRSTMDAIGNLSGGIHEHFDANIVDEDPSAPPSDYGLPREEIEKIYNTWDKATKEYYQKQMAGYANEAFDDHYCRNAAYDDTITLLKEKAANTK